MWAIHLTVSGIKSKVSYYCGFFPDASTHSCSTVAGLAYTITTLADCSSQASCCIWLTFSTPLRFKREH